MADNKNYRFFYHYGYHKSFPHSKYTWVSTDELIEVTEKEWEEIVELEKQIRCDTHRKWHRPVAYLRVPKNKTISKSL